MSFLEQALKKQASRDAAVPEELLDAWVDDEDELPAAFLLHPRVRGVTTEEDVRGALTEAKLTLTGRIKSGLFRKLAEKMRRRPAQVPMGVEPADALAALDLGEGSSSSGTLSDGIAKLDEILTPARWNAKDEAPARVAADLYIGSGDHAADVSVLRRLGITAVLNCAPTVCEDPTALYEACVRRARGDDPPRSSASAVPGLPVCARTRTHGAPVPPLLARPTPSQKRDGLRGVRCRGL
jgi:hypothetical protein